MSEIAEIGRVLDEAGKQRRASNRASGQRLLREAGAKFEVKADGAHLIVRSGDRVFDFWPGTGKWIERGTDRYRRGVFKLLRTLEQKPG